MLPRIFCPSRWISLVTTWGYLLLMEFRAPSGSLASSESLTACTVVARFMWVRVSTWLAKAPSRGHSYNMCSLLAVFDSMKTVLSADLWPLTTPIRSPRPYSPASSFFPLSFAMTERSRPLRTMKVLSDLSPCLKTTRFNGAHYHPKINLYYHMASRFKNLWVYWCMF